MSPRRPDQHPERRLPTWAKVLLGVAAVVVLVPLALAAWFFWSFSGGWDGIRPQPEPDDRQVVRARERAPQPLDRRTAATLADVGGAEIARARTDECRQGQNNWKIHDGYKLRCELTDVVVLTAPAARVREAAARLDARLRAAGYQPMYDGAGLAEPNSGGILEKGSYHGPNGDLGIEVLTAGGGLDSFATSDAPVVSGDAEQVRAALAQPGVVRVVVHVTEQYFDD